jgi:poly(glycerol-phosphate) alpha-glucosyltransferase
VAALQLHDAMRQAGLASQLVSTRAADFPSTWPGVSQFPRHGPGRLFYSPGLVDAAHQALKDGSKIVHGHGLYVYPNHVFGREARRHDLPLVYHVHGFFEPWILGRSRFKKRVAHWLFEDANFKQVRLWRALTSREADQIRTVAGNTAPILVAPNCIDLTPFLSLKSKPAARRRALFLGRLHPKKGLDLLVQAWASLGEATKDWELVIAGPDEGGHEATVRNWVESAGLGAHVTFTGSVSGSAKYELLASADLFVLTSYSEGFPMAPLEAMAASVPVALTHECNLPEAAAAEAGWSCAAEPTSVKKMLGEALSAGETELTQRGRAGRRLVETRFAWRNTVASLNEACMQIL